MGSKVSSIFLTIQIRNYWSSELRWHFKRGLRWVNLRDKQKIIKKIETLGLANQGNCVEKSVTL